MVNVILFKLILTYKRLINGNIYHIMNTKRPSRTWLFIFVAIMTQFLQTNAQAAEIDFIRNVKDADVEFIIKVNEVKKLAGLKISITYPDQLITYSDCIRPAETSSFMHVVNSKNSGELIIVMASAKGISGENIPLLNLQFKLLNAHNRLPLAMKASKCQLMDENLNEIKCEVGHQ